MKSYKQSDALASEGQEPEQDSLEYWIDVLAGCGNSKGTPGHRAARELLAALRHDHAQVPRDWKERAESAESVVEKYATAARVIGLHLRQFCDESLPYDEMIAEASRRAAAALTLADSRRQQLIAYVQHRDGCEAWPQFTGHLQGATKVGRCTCGLADQLAALGGENP